LVIGVPGVRGDSDNLCGILVLPLGLLGVVRPSVASDDLFSLGTHLQAGLNPGKDLLKRESPQLPLKAGYVIGL